MMIFQPANFFKYINRLNGRVGHGVSWLTLALVLLIVGEVLMRYLFMRSSIALQELEWHLFGLIFLLGAGYTLRENDHVRVDFLSSRFSPLTRARVDYWGTLLLLAPFCLALIYTSRHFVYNAWLSMEGSPNPGGLPYRYLIRAAIPAGFFLLLLQGLVLAANNYQTIQRLKDEAAQQDGGAV